MDANQAAVLDVRLIPQPERHQRIFERYAQLPPGAILALLADHEPRNLRAEFDRDHPGTHRWQAEQLADGQWRVAITKLASTPAPRLMANTGQLTAAAADTQMNGAIWKLEPSARDLDANIIALAAGQEIGQHAGPELDVLLHVFDGDGVLHTETGAVPLHPGDVIYLPARSRRRFTAGPHGLRYLSVHQRKRTLGLLPTRRA